VLPSANVYFSSIYKTSLGSAAKVENVVIYKGNKKERKGTSPIVSLTKVVLSKNFQNCIVKDYDATAC